MTGNNPFDLVTYPNVSSGYDYALKVISGEIPNCIFVIGAAKRFLRDLKENDKFYFDPEKAERYLRMVQRLEHIKGEWKTPNVVFEPWQNFVWMNIMGFISKETGYRRFRTAHIEVPRGCGKSLMASQAVLYFLALDGPVGNEISTLATKRDQARIVFDSARAMALKSKSFIKATGVKVLAHKITHDKSNSVARPLSSEANGLDGLSDVLAILDELHAMRRDTFDVITSGMKKRRDSLILCITTAGFNTDSVGASQSAYAKKVSLGEVEDETFFSAVYTIDEKDVNRGVMKTDDIFEEATWRKANPNYGTSVDPEAIRATAMKAKVTPADLPNFKVKNLNIWLSEAKAFYELAKWEECAKPELKLEDFRGQRAVVALDLASKIDLTSIGIMFHKHIKSEVSGEPGIDEYYFFDKSYIPEARVIEVRKSGALYDNCIASGHLIQTPGEAIHYPNITKDIVALRDQLGIRVEEVLYDPWNCAAIAQDLIARRFECVEFRMNTANLSEPTKRLDALMRQKRIFHNGSPLLRWCVGNVVCTYDAVDNVFPKKGHVDLKIDPAIVLIMALASYLQKAHKASVYEVRGIRVL